MVAHGRSQVARTPGVSRPGPLRLHLASASPRRRMLLEQAGFAHTAAPPPLDDAALSAASKTPLQWVAALAYLKADAAARVLEAAGQADVLTLGADTVVVKGREILSAPRDRDDAERILRALRGGEHEVCTGAALVRPGRERQIIVDRARVRLGRVPDDALLEYLGSEQWRGKAGGYNLAERIEAGWPIEFTGDPATVMGLPMQRLAPMLRAALGEREERRPEGVG